MQWSQVSDTLDSEAPVAFGAAAAAVAPPAEPMVLLAYDNRWRQQSEL